MDVVPGGYEQTTSTAGDAASQSIVRYASPVGVAVAVPGDPGVEVLVGVPVMVGVAVTVGVCVMVGVWVVVADGSMVPGGRLEGPNATRRSLAGAKIMPSCYP